MTPPLNRPATQTPGRVNILWYNILTPHHALHQKSQRDRHFMKMHFLGLYMMKGTISHYFIAIYYDSLFKSNSRSIYYGKLF